MGTKIENLVELVSVAEVKSLILELISKNYLLREFF